MKTFLFAVVAALFALPALAHDGVHIDDAYARIIGDSANSGAVFMEIVNHSDTDDRLIAARTEIAGMAELHTHVMGDDGVMKMMPVEGGIEVPALGGVSLKRGGLHVMLMQLTSHPAEGETFTLVLTFEHAGEVTIEVPVQNDHQPGTGASAESADH